MQKRKRSEDDIYDFIANQMLSEQCNLTRTERRLIKVCTKKNKE